MGIKFKQLNYKNYLKNLNIEIDSKRIISVISNNEIYVNSLFDLLYGIDLPDKGDIVINKFVLNKETNKKKLENIRKQIAYLPFYCIKQLFNITILDDIKFGLDKFDEKKLYELLDLFKLDINILKKTFMELSDSEKKKVSLIAVFLRNAPIILLNEPISTLDSKSIQVLIKILKRERKNGKLVIVSSRNSEFLFKVSDSVLVINDKKVELKNDKNNFFYNESLMNKLDMDVPNIIKIHNIISKSQEIKLSHREDINDLIKDIYRNAK